MEKQKAAIKVSIVPAPLNAVETDEAKKSSSSQSLLVNNRQRGNPILKFVRNILWEYGEVVPDYEFNAKSCAMFLSLRYHQLHPDYIHDRLQQLGKKYALRVMLVQVDVTDPHHMLKDLAKVCILAECSLILAFSAEEAGRYLETYKAYENKPPDSIMERVETDPKTRLAEVLTTVRSVNKTDANTLAATFGSFENIVRASEDELAFCPGFGPQKAKRLYSALHEPFKKTRKSDDSMKTMKDK